MLCYAMLCYAMLYYTILHYKLFARARRGQPILYTIYDWRGWASVARLELRLSGFDAASYGGV